MGILAPSLPEHNPENTLGASHRRPPPQLVVRRGAAQRGLDMRLRMLQTPFFLPLPAAAARWRRCRLAARCGAARPGHAAQDRGRCGLLAPWPRRRPLPARGDGGVPGTQRQLVAAARQSSAQQGEARLSAAWTRGPRWVTLKS